MPYERPGAGVYVTATKITAHNAPCTENGLVGVAVKQKARSWSQGLVNPETIAIGEAFHIRVKGIKQVPNTGITAGTKGQGVYIRPSDNSLHLEGATAAGDLPFGRIVETVGDNRGVPAQPPTFIGTTKVRIDLDQKDTLAAA